MGVTSVIVVVIVTCVVMIVGWSSLLVGLHARFVERFLKFAFQALYVDFDAVVFGRVWGDAVAEVGGATLTDNNIWLNQSEMRSTAVLVGGGAAVARKTHRS